MAKSQENNISPFFQQRRGLLKSIACGGAFLASSRFIRSASAAQNDDTEWAQNYDDGGQQTRNVITQTPILSQSTIQATEGAIRVYQTIVTNGGHKPLPTEKRLQIGVNHPNVRLVRDRLIELGDLSPNVGGGKRI